MKRAMVLGFCTTVLLARVASAQRTITVGKLPWYDYSFIQRAINAAIDGDTIIVHPGTYGENVHFKGKDIVLRSTDPANEATVALTMIDGNRNGSAVTFAGTESSNCVLAGFTIANGGSYTYKTAVGGGVSGNGTRATLEYNRVIYNGMAYLGGGGIANCNGTIRNNLILGNWSFCYGGGLYNCHGLIHDNTIEGNYARLIGGGIFHAAGTVRDNVIRDNHAFWAGGGLVICSGLVLSNTIQANQAGDAGGGLLWCHGTVLNNLVTRNVAAIRGGGITACYGTIQNNTIAANHAIEGAALYDCKGTIQDCIVWANTSPIQVEQCNVPTFSCIQAWTGGGVGNINVDPLFVSGSPGDYCLSDIKADQFARSPCIDAGSVMTAERGLAEWSTRTDGQPDTGMIDIGYHRPASPTSPTIVGWPPQFDLAVREGCALVPQAIRVRNRGGGTASYQIISSPSALAVISPSQGQASGTATQSHTVTFQTRGLWPGRYAGSLVIQSHAAWNSPVTIPFRIKVLGIPRSDLTLSGVDAGPVAPTELQPGQPMVVSAFLENLGPFDSPPFWVEVWGSRTGGLTLDCNLTASLGIGAGLPAGGSYSWATPTPLLPVPEGSYTVVYVVDRPNDAPETNERNNRAIVPGKRLLISRPQSRVDLVVEGFAAPLDPFEPDATVTFSGLVTNRGTEPSGPFWIEFWGSMGLPYPSLDCYVCDSIGVPNLDPGESIDLSDYSRQLYWWLPDVSMVGCFADQGGTVSEIDETNNYQFLPFRPGPPPPATGPDLVITRADFTPSAPTRMTPGEWTSITVEVANVGTSETGRFWVEHWLSPDGGVTLERLFLGSHGHPSLAPGQSTTLGAASDSLSFIPDGSYTVVVAVDRPGDVAETNEANNRLAIAAKRLLTFRPTTQANLTLEGFTTTGTAFGGTVRNIGSQDSGFFLIEFRLAFGDSDYPEPQRYAADSISVVNLPAGGVLDIASHKRTFYPDIPAGTYAVIGHVDGADNVAETDETDNYQIVRGVNLGR